ncbi:hypothetical protein Aperf_G00000092801 [Anoplocephala perfoliata]
MDDDPICRRLRANIKYDILQEILLNLEYDNAFGGLGHNEKKLLNVYREAWSDCHMGKSLLSNIKRPPNPDISDLFWSRFEEKVDEKLASVEDDIMLIEDPESVRQVNKVQQGKLFRQAARLPEVVSGTISAQKDLFSRRSAMQKDLIHGLGRVLSREVKALAAKTAKLEENIHSFILQPSQRTSDLRSIYTNLLEKKKELEVQISSLSNKLNTYRENERRYLELAYKKVDAQRQINFVHHLQNQQNDDVEPPKQVFRYTNL